MALLCIVIIVIIVCSCVFSCSLTFCNKDESVIFCQANGSCLLQAPVKEPALCAVRQQAPPPQQVPHPFNVQGDTFFATMAIKNSSMVQCLH